MTSAAMLRELPHSVDREAAELRRRWWDDRETTPELVLDIARFEARTSRVIIAPGEATRPGLLEVAGPLLAEHPEEATLHRVVKEAAQAMPVKDRTVCYREADGKWRVSWPGQGLDFVVEGDEAPWSAGTHRWKIADAAFHERQPAWRVIRRLLRGVPQAYPERDSDAVHTLRFNEERGTWCAYLSYIEDVIMADHIYSLEIQFRPGDSQVEIFESVDTE